MVLLLQGDIQLTYDRIESGEFDFPDFVAPDAQHLIRLVGLLESDYFWWLAI